MSLGVNIVTKGQSLRRHDGWDRVEEVKKSVENGEDCLPNNKKQVEINNAFNNRHNSCSNSIIIVIVVVVQESWSESSII